MDHKLLVFHKWRQDHLLGCLYVFALKLFRVCHNDLVSLALHELICYGLKEVGLAFLFWLFEALKRHTDIYDAFRFCAISKLLSNIVQNTSFLGFDLKILAQFSQDGILVHQRRLLLRTRDDLGLRLTFTKYRDLNLRPLL